MVAKGVSRTEGSHPSVSFSLGKPVRISIKGFLARAGGVGSCGLIDVIWHLNLLLLRKHHQPRSACRPDVPGRSPEFIVPTYLLLFEFVLGSSSLWVRRSMHGTYMSPDKHAFDKTNDIFWVDNIFPGRFAFILVG